MTTKILAVGLVCMTAATAVGCTPERASKGDPVRVSTSANALGSGAGNVGTASWAVADPASTVTTSTPLDVSLVLTAMRKVQSTYYNGKDFDKQALPAGFNADEPRQCLSACPAYYSDVVCHFYCWHPSYSSVSPNTRGCFTNIARGNFVGTIGQPLLYPQIYDYCTYQPFDAVTNPTNAIPGTPSGVLRDGGVANPLRFDVQEIEKNKKAGKKPGVNAWVDNNERDAFKQVMFTWYDPTLYSVESQQDALNQFYGVTLSKPDYALTDTADVAACKAGRRRSATDDAVTPAGVPIVPDGMECSTAKNYADSHKRHPNWAAITAFMKSSDPSVTEAGPSAPQAK